jgi:hypothetical protein
MFHALMLALLLVLPPVRQAAPRPQPLTMVTVVVQDASGAALKNELVILRNLDDHGKEIARALTDQNGEIPTVNVAPGLYRAIATAPYTLWKTEVREFMVSDAPARLVLEIELLPPSGDAIPIRTKQISVRVMAPNGRPAGGASIVARDEDATL